MSDCRFGVSPVNYLDLDLDQISVIVPLSIRLVFKIFKIKYCLTEVLEQPGGGTPVAKRDQRHTNVIKHRTLLRLTLFCFTARPRLPDW